VQTIDIKKKEKIKFTKLGHPNIDSASTRTSILAHLIWN